MYAAPRGVVSLHLSPSVISMGSEQFISKTDLKIFRKSPAKFVCS